MAEENRLSQCHSRPDVSANARRVYLVITRGPGPFSFLPEFLGKNIRDVLPELAEKFLCFDRTVELDEPPDPGYKLCINGKDRWFEAASCLGKHVDHGS